MKREPVCGAFPPMAAFKHALVLTALDNLALTMIRTLASKGVKATVAGTGSGRLLRLSRHCSAYAQVARSAAEFSQAKDQALERAAFLARERGADLVVPVDIPGVLFAEKLKARLPGATFFPSLASDIPRLLEDNRTFYGMLREKFRDPLPELYGGARTLLGAKLLVRALRI